MTKLFALTVLSGCLVFPTLGVAQEKVDEHAGHHADVQTADKQAGAAPEAQTQHMRDNMKKMHELMDKVHAANTPEERQKLLEQHHAAMHEQMRTMRGMMGGGKTRMMSGKGASDKSNPGGMMDGEMLQHHQAMMNRMDMMQDMMEQMMEHMSAEHHGMQPDSTKKK